MQKLKMLLLACVILFATTNMLEAASEPIYGTELVLGGGNENGAVDESPWIALGDLFGINTRLYNNNTFLYPNQKYNNGGCYQAIPTVVGKQYNVSAILLGTDVNGNEIFSSSNASYITIDSSAPTLAGVPDHLTNMVTGSIETTESFIFTATSTTSYISLRSTKAYNYPNARAISVKEVLGEIEPGDDITPPVITVNGSNPMTIIQGEPYIELEATATDNVDGTVAVTITGSVDTTTVGTYTITYTARDSAGNTATETRTVNVVNDEQVTVHYTCKSPGMIALTFDDGVTGNYDRLLDILDTEDVPVTFFIIGGKSNNALDKERLMRAYIAGHQIANHTWSHTRLTELSDAEIEIELTDTNSFIIDTIGYGSVYMRPPFGNIDTRVVNKLLSLGYLIVKWNLDPKDWVSNITSNEMFTNFQNVISNADPSVDSFISLQHDWNRDSIELVPDFISLGKSKGFTFVTIEECLQ